MSWIEEGELDKVEEEELDWIMINDGVEKVEEPKFCECNLRRLTYNYIVVVC